MSITKYKTKRSAPAEVEAVECVRETDHFVVIAGHAREWRAAKVSDWERYHDTWEAAYAYLMDRAERAVRNAQANLQHAQGALGDVKGMKPPIEG